MPNLLCLTTLLLALVLGWPPASGAITADQIMARVDARPRLEDMTARQEMTLIDKQGNKRRRQLKLYVLNQNKDHFRLLFFLSPPDIKGIGLLTHDYHDAGRDDDQWIFMPALGRTKRIASRQRTLSFMGSDFTYADLTRPRTADWNYRLLKEETWLGKPVWLVEALPKDDQTLDRWGYKKSVLFVRRDLDMIVRSVHWLRESRKIKYVDLLRLENHRGVWLGTEVRAKTALDGLLLHQTDLRLEVETINTGIKRDIFSIRGLERGP